MANVTSAAVAERDNGIFGLSLDTLEMDEGAIATVLSVAIMGVAAVRLAYWIATYRWLLVGVLTAWVLWLLHAALRASSGVSSTLDDVWARGTHVHESSTELVLSVQRFLLAWFNLLLPFWSDVLAAAVTTWTVLDPRVKWGAAVVAAVAYSLVTAYRRARRLQQKHGKTVRALLFQASFLATAPALWFGAPYVLPGRLLPLTVAVLLSPMPAALSGVAFSAAGTGTVRTFAGDWFRSTRDVEVGMGRCLSYWACWPSVVFARDLLAQTQFGEGSEVQRAMLVLLVWLQVWDGARHVPELMWRAAVDVGLPVWRVVTTNLPEWVQNPTSAVWRHAGTVTAALAYVRDNKYVAMAAALIGLIVLQRVLGAFSALFTLMIWWGASLKTTRLVHRYTRGAVPHRNAGEDYRPMLAFWVLGLLYQSALALRVPVLSQLLSLWQPLFLALALSMGDTLLDTLLVLVAPALGALLGVVRAVLSSLGGSGPAAAAGAGVTAAAGAGAGAGAPPRRSGVTPTPRE